MGITDAVKNTVEGIGDAALRILISRGKPTPTKGDIDPLDLVVLLFSRERVFF